MPVLILPGCQLALAWRNHIHQNQWDGPVQVYVHPDADEHV